MNESWKKIIYFLESSECEKVHKFYSRVGGWAYLTDRTGRRHKLTKEDNLLRVQHLVAYIKGLNLLDKNLIV